MPDRVAWIGGLGLEQTAFWGNPTAAGLSQVSDRDHFPFPVYDATFDDLLGVGDGEYAPVLMTPAQALFFFFVCKNWRYTSSEINWQGGTYTYSPLTFDTTRTQARESDLVVNSFLDQNTVIQQAGGNLAYAYFLPFIAIDPSAVWSSGIYPVFEVGFWEKDSDDVLPNPEFDARVLTTYDRGRAGVTGGTLSIVNALGTINLGLYKKSPDDFAADIVMECIEYWPYATKSGDPVYDTATGARLRDPLS